jgi:curved DNA-binding protein
MKDYYGILGVPKTASAEEIKKAYRKAAMKHHPDRGGDQARFKEINEAYDILSDNEKRAQLDQGIDPLNQNGGFRAHNFQNMEDIFSSFGFNFGFGQQNFNQTRNARNKNLNVNMTLTLEEAYTGITKSISIKYPNGSEKVLNITIPPGVDNGMAIRYSGMGDNTITSLPAGDLNILIKVTPHHKFAREGFNLLTDVNIDCFQAILGTTVDIETLDKRILQVIIPAGTQPNTTLGLKNEGMHDGKGSSGKLYVRVGIVIPKISDPYKLDLIKKIKN